MISFLSKKTKPNKWNLILKSDVIIIDDVFYITPTYEELLEFYRTLIFLSETRSVVLVTNRELSTWKDMKVDIHLLETLKARLLSEAQLIHLKKIYNLLIKLRLKNLILLKLIL